MKATLFSLCCTAAALHSASATFIPFHRSPLSPPSSSSLRRRGSRFSTQSQGTSSRVSSVKNLATSSGTGTDGAVGLSDINDLLYLANVTIGGQDYSLQLDSGSSDLVVMSKVSNAKLSTLSLNLTYGVGYAAGTIATTSVSFADMNVSTQAYLNVADSQNPITSFGAVGIMGLGFTSLSNIDATVQGADKSATWGRSFLFNAFAQNPAEPNYITFALERASDGSSGAEGGFTIGELVEEHAGVESTPSIATFPESNPSRWNILAEAYETSAGKVTFSSVVSNAPSGNAVILLDTGTSYVYAPEAFVTAIYGTVKGANYSAAAGQWNVPCDAQIFLGIWIGGRRFDLHPLDLVVPDLSKAGACLGSFLPQALAVGSGEFDIVAGDVFLRNVYSLFDFGDFTDSSNLTMGNPYVKLLSTTNITAASLEFNKVRGGNTTLQISNSGDAFGATTTGSSTASSPKSTAGTTLTLQQLSDKVDNLKSYTPALIGVLGANVLIMLVLIGVLVFFLVRKKGGNGGSSVGTGRRPFKRRGGNTVSTMELAGGPEGGDADGANGSGPAKYAPVSLTNPDGTPAYETPAYRQSAAVSFRTNDAYRESAVL